MPGDAAKDILVGQTNVPVDLPQVAELLRLTNQLHRLPHDPAARKRLLLDGLSRLIGATEAACVVVRRESSGVLSVLSEVDTRHAAASPRKRKPRRKPGRPSIKTGPNPMFRAALDHMSPQDAGRPSSADRLPVASNRQLFSFLELDQKGILAGLILSRGPRATGAFPAEAKALIDLVHAEMRWVYASDLPLASPDVLSLPPRPRETLQYLLAGNGEKQIAAHLQLSVNTVHHYVKRLYRHFGVSSRSELLARWVTK